MAILSVAVFCGSRSGRNPAYETDAKAVGTLLAEHNIKMVFGGGKNGLMGCVADAVLANGGQAFGVIPTGLDTKESRHTGLTELVVAETMHDRKRRMYESCDAALILPGGFGTLDELFEVVTWNGLALHDKKVFLLNSAGFYNHLLRHLQLLEREGFLYDPLTEMITVLNTAEELRAHLR